MVQSFSATHRPRAYAIINITMHLALNGYFWDQPHTGSGQYLRHLWEALSELTLLEGARPDTLTLFLPGGVSHADVPTGPRSRAVEAVPTPLLGGRSSSLEKLLWEGLGVARAARSEGAQLLHVPYLTAPIIKSCSTVVTAHDMIPWVVPGYRGSWAVRLYLAIAVASVRRSDFIIADSEASRRDLLKVLKVPPRKVHTVYLGVEPHPVYTADQLREARTRIGLPEHFAFYLGGFDRRKNVPLLLRAWSQALSSMQTATGVTAEEPVLAIGGGIPAPGGVFPDVRAEAAALGFSDEGEGGPIRFLGRISEDDKAMLMSAARIFVYPSSYEGFGLDVLGAMSIGCPVVSSSGGSLREVVGDAGLLVPPGDIAALASAIAQAWSDDSLLSQLGKKGRERAQLFTWEKTARQTYDVYNLALARTLRTRSSKGDAAGTRRVA